MGGGNKMPRGGGAKLGNPSVDVAADQHALGTQVGLSDAAVETRAAVQLRIDDDAVSAPDSAGAARIDHVAGHLVAHDARVVDGNRPAVDLVVRPANAALGD